MNAYYKVANSLRINSNLCINFKHCALAHMMCQHCCCRKRSLRCSIAPKTKFHWFHTLERLEAPYLYFDKNQIYFCCCKGSNVIRLPETVFYYSLNVIFLLSEYFGNLKLKFNTLIEMIFWRNVFILKFVSLLLGRPSFWSLYFELRKSDYHCSAATAKPTHRQLVQNYSFNISYENHTIFCSYHFALPSKNSSDETAL